MRDEHQYNIYTELGYINRYAYFEQLSEKFNVPTIKILYKAEELGIDQDFDKLLDWVLQESKKCCLIKKKFKNKIKKKLK